MDQVLLIEEIVGGRTTWGGTVNISTLTHNHIKLDRAIADLKRTAESLGDKLNTQAQSRAILNGKLSEVRALFDTHAANEEAELLPSVLDLLGELPEIALIIEQHEDLDRTISALESMCADSNSTSFLIRSTIDDFILSFDKHSITEADFLDTVALTVAPSSFSDG